MGASNDITDLGSLAPEVLAEVVREGETTLAAQLTVALASDQRALSFAGIVLTAATAAFGGAAALGIGEKPDRTLALVATGFGIAMMVSGCLAVFLARPAQHCLPGNEPMNWLPDRWAPNTPRDMKQARVEQATILQSMITKNRRTAASAARGLRRALIVAYGATALSGAALAAIGFDRAQAVEKSKGAPAQSRKALPIKVSAPDSASRLNVGR